MVHYCLIPADPTEPMLVRDFLRGDDDIGAFTKELNAHFSREGSTADVKILEEQVRGQMPSGGAELNQGMLEQLAQSQMVDIVPLVPGVEATDWTAVSMYVDDKGIPKGLPVNTRASALAAACGQMVEVRGDAFISRLRDDQNDIFERLDFTLDELSGDAPWVSIARDMSRKRSAAGTQEQLRTMLSTDQRGKAPAIPAAEGLPKVKGLRGEGTDAFKRGDFSTALRSYREADHLVANVLAQDDEELASALRAERLSLKLNLAATHLKLGSPFDALKECDAAVALDAESGKAWYRRGLACMEINQLQVAKRNLMQAARLEPKNREIRLQLEKCAELLKASGTAPLPNWIDP